MIRTTWVALVTLVSTAYHALLAIAASLVGVKGAFYARVTRDWGRSILRASGVRVFVHGAEHIRPDEPQIVVSNHVSGYDIFALASVLPKEFRFVGKKELDRIPIFGLAWRAAGHISLDRSDRRRAIESLRAAGRHIQETRSTVIIFPEGTRSRDGRLLPFKKGAFILAREAQVPIVPTAISGSRGIVGPGWRIHPRAVHVHFEPPIEPARIEREGAERIRLEVEGSMRQRLIGLGVVPAEEPVEGG